MIPIAIWQKRQTTEPMSMDAPDSFDCICPSVRLLEQGMSEIWKPVVGYEGFYEVSDIGCVRSVDRDVDIKGILASLMGVTLKQHQTPPGYTVVKLCRNGSGNSFRVHRLVAAAFIPNPKNKSEVNHINGVKHDNRIENLEWATPKENSRHAHATGIKTCNGEKNSNAKLNNLKVRIIRRMCELSLWSDPEIAAMFDVTDSAIYKVRRGISWTHVPSAEIESGK